MPDEEILEQLTRLYETTPNPANAKMIEKMITILDAEWTKRFPDIQGKEWPDGGS